MKTSERVAAIKQAERNQKEREVQEAIDKLKEKITHPIRYRLKKLIWW